MIITLILVAVATVCAVLLIPKVREIREGLAELRKPRGPRGFLVALGAAVLLAVAPACLGPKAGGIDPAAVEASWRAVAARHDTYVRQDPALDEIARETYLATSELLIGVLEAALEAQAQGAGN